MNQQQQPLLLQQQQQQNPLDNHHDVDREETSLSLTTTSSETLTPESPSYSAASACNYKALSGAARDQDKAASSLLVRQSNPNDISNNNDQEDDPVMLEDSFSDEEDDTRQQQQQSRMDTVEFGSILELTTNRRLPSTIYEDASAPLLSLRTTTPISDNNQRGSVGNLQAYLQQEEPFNTDSYSTPGSLRSFQQQQTAQQMQQQFLPYYTITRFLQRASQLLLQPHHTQPFASATWIGFWALFLVACGNHVLMPVRDAIALSVGVQHMPALTLASTSLAVLSSVPIGWLFEAPNPSRRRLWKNMGLTRGETQGTSLALFYRCFAGILVAYAAFFWALQVLQSTTTTKSSGSSTSRTSRSLADGESTTTPDSPYWDMNYLWTRIGQLAYIMFFLIVHLMKLHSTSLIWGVTTEAMEYEEVARKKSHMESSKMRLQRLALIGFGGTLGGILGSALASTMAKRLKLPGLLLVAALLLEVSAELSIELGRIMQKHWTEQQLFQSSNDLASMDSSMKRSSSLGSMKRVASGNSINRVHSTSELNKQSSSTPAATTAAAGINDNTFMQRLLRGVTTILRSRLLMAIFTYNALYASTTVLLSFQRAALVANRDANTTAEADTAFLANINMASSVAVFALQATGAGAYVAHRCGQRGTLSLMPLIRLLGVFALAWWHHTSNGQPPNLLIFLVVDECCKIMNMAVAKPVRESLWRGLSNEARYEAKPIVDTLANRWGGGSAAFLVSFLDKTLNLFGVMPGSDGVRYLFGFPPVLLLCMVIATWWAAVSADLGVIRTKIDQELKKMV